MSDLEDYCDLEIACVSINWDPTTQLEVVNCPIKCEEGWCNNSVIINHEFIGPEFFFNGPNGGEKGVIQIIPAEQKNTSFANFA